MKTAFPPNFAVILVMAAALVLGPGPALAQSDNPDTVLISNSVAKVTRADYDTELLRLPIETRAGFANNPRRVNDLLTRMLVQKTLAVQARNAKVDVAPENALRLRMEVDRLLGQLYIERLEAEAGAEFDASRSRYEARARELYVIDRARFERPEQLVVTHILFDPKKRGADAAKALAFETRAKIVAGADMGALAKAQSDDPSAQTNNGRIDWFGRKEMDAAFADAAFALQKSGDVSEPIQSQFGWHVIRLEARRAPEVPPFEMVREALLQEQRKKFVDERREAAIASIRRDAQTQVNREAVDALTPRVDIDAAKRALGMVPDAPASAAPSAAPAPR